MQARCEVKKSVSPCDGKYAAVKFLDISTEDTLRQLEVQ